MKNISKNELKEILEKHKKWLYNEEGGEKADLRGADLKGANLSEADLREANLRGAYLYRANLSEADLSEADLYRANLSEADLSGADLYRANLREANLKGSDLYRADLREADLYRADLREADLSEADLYRANLSEADLYRANLSEADLSGADLKGANLSEADLSEAYLYRANLREAKNIPYISMFCPEEGSFIGWKKGIIFVNGYTQYALIKLEILKDSLRSSATTKKCRCDKAKVLKITSIDEKNEYNEAYSNFDSAFSYKVGEIVKVDDFCEDRFNECAPGIHFFINKQDAINYVF